LLTPAQWPNYLLAVVECGMNPHGITHVLQRLSRHSESGVMKAHWNDRDLEQMAFRPLSFEAADVEWIRAGIRATTPKRCAFAIHAPFPNDSIPSIPLATGRRRAPAFRSAELARGG
jgi:hypothetical protein